MNFERGNISIKKTLDIGLNSKPRKGGSFLIRFKLRQSCPDYYPLQELEREGKSVIAIALDEPNPMVYDPVYFNPYKSIKCSLPDLKISTLANIFIATWNYDEDYWEIA